MVEKVITSGPNVVDFARYQAGRNASAMSGRTCRYCGAVLSEGESEDECSSAFNVETPSLREPPRKFYAE
jgi:hypothetical protein